MNAENLVRRVARHVGKLLAKQGAIYPLYHYIKADGQQGVFTAPPFCKSKDQLVAYAKAVFEAEDAVAYVFLSETWTLETALSREEFEVLMEKYGSLEHFPGRSEAVAIMGEDADDMVMGKMLIHRPEGRKPYLGDLEISRPENIEGRMVGLLPQRGTRQ